MSLLAKAIVKNKCWVVEDDNNNKVGTIMTNPQGVVYQHDQTREQFANLKMLSDKYNIVVDKAAPRKIITESNDVYGFPVNIKLTISYGTYGTNCLSLLKVLKVKVSSVLDIILSNLITAGLSHTVLN